MPFIESIALYVNNSPLLAVGQRYILKSFAYLNNAPVCMAHFVASGGSCVVLYAPPTQGNSLTCPGPDRCIGEIHFSCSDIGCSGWTARTLIQKVVSPLPGVSVLTILSALVSAYIFQPRVNCLILFMHDDTFGLFTCLG